MGTDSSPPHFQVMITAFHLPHPPPLYTHTHAYTLMTKMKITGAKMACTPVVCFIYMYILRNTFGYFIRKGDANNKNTKTTTIKTVIKNWGGGGGARYRKALLKMKMWCWQAEPHSMNCISQNVFHNGQHSWPILSNTSNHAHTIHTHTCLIDTVII